MTDAQHTQSTGKRKLDVAASPTSFSRRYQSFGCLIMVKSRTVGEFHSARYATSIRPTSINLLLVDLSNPNHLFMFIILIFSKERN